MKFRGFCGIFIAESTWLFVFGLLEGKIVNFKVLEKDDLPLLAD
jgi:hypothetical protein